MSPHWRRSDQQRIVDFAADSLRVRFEIGTEFKPGGSPIGHLRFGTQTGRDRVEPRRSQALQAGGSRHAIPGKGFAPQGITLFDGRHGQCGFDHNP